MRGGVGLAVIATILVGGGCGDPITRPPDRLTLTASQAAALLNKTSLIASNDPSLAWLADSIECVLKAGAEVQLIAVTVDGVERSYYAVGLTRQFKGANTFSTFHLIGFDSPENPVGFLLANGYAQGTGGTTPTSATGTFGGSSVFAHLVHVSGPDITEWTAFQGDAALVVGDPGAACMSTMTVTCNAATLVADFRIDVARPVDKPNEVHVVAQTHVVVPGILLVFN